MSDPSLPQSSEAPNEEASFPLVSTRSVGTSMVKRPRKKSSQPEDSLGGGQPQKKPNHGPCLDGGIAPLPNVHGGTQAEASTSVAVDEILCEICSVTISDLEQLRTHMDLIHKVQIDPRMLTNRPPLSCQYQCQLQFFTEEGLGLHLLCIHGLVTSHMQDLVNQNQDAGLCTICWQVVPKELVTHMKQRHKMNLKPVESPYKCTVCCETFNLYTLFENHVFMAHSNWVKHRVVLDDGAGTQVGGH